MIGKNSYLSYNLLLLITTVAILLNAILFKNNLLIVFYLLSFFISIYILKIGLKFLKSKKILQKIRLEGPECHIKTKAKVPTIGGIFFIPIILLIVLFIDIPSLSLKIILMFTITGFLFIGLIDDLLSIKNQTNLGLKGKEKLYLQTIISLIFTIFIWKYNYINPNLFMVNNQLINSGLFIIPFSLLTIIGFSNSVNLTDGLDGLAAGCSSIVFCGLGTEILLNDPTNVGFSILSFSMSGLCLGFLNFNRYPAKIFMGDTGSLSIGAILGATCVLTNSFHTIFLISGIFIVESLSVILQVSYFKITKKFFDKGKKIFLMTPIHHHFELQGFHEQKIVSVFWIINISLVIFSIVLKISF